MTATTVIEEIEQMPPEEQSRVIQYAIELARKRQLTGKELAVLASAWLNPTTRTKLKN